ncbi:MAG: beta-ketoacyl synthase N-terminal-like domain-containing protein [Nitrospiraceae bacterium]|nr:beta-ketoacyl synthase N-terminal-like domain-containing protein [Nitrospiraceae bacterium]
MTDTVVITGAGITTSIGHTVSGIWTALVAGNTGIRPLGNGSPDAAATVSGLDPAALGIHPRDARIMGRHSHMLIKASRDAYAAAGIVKGDFAPEEIGFFAGMGMVDYSISDLMPGLLKSLRVDGSIDYDLFFDSGFREIHPLWPLSMLNNISFCQAAIGLDIRGENTVFSPHADSGARAIAEGVRTVLERKAKIALAGGVSEAVSPEALARGRYFGVISRGEGDGNGTCMPFGQNRSGTIFGEGCGIVSLELRSSAEARGAGYDTMITGYGSSCRKDAEANCPAIDAIALSMKQALAQADTGPEGIDLVIAHGDGTLRGDGNEAEAIGLVFSGLSGQPAVYSSKPAFGHLLAGAPAVDLIIGSAMITQGIVPAVTGAYTTDPTIGFTLVKGQPLPLRPKRVLINALSYEGQCSSLIIEAAVHQR